MKDTVVPPGGSVRDARTLSRRTLARGLGLSLPALLLGAAPAGAEETTDPVAHLSDLDALSSTYATAAAVDLAKDAAATAALTVISADTTRHKPRVASLIHGGSTSPAGLNGTVTVAPGKGYEGSAEGLTLTATGGFTSLGVRVAVGSPLALGKAQAICVAVDIPDVTKVGHVTATLYHDSGRTVPLAWSRNTADTPVQTLANGLNVIRFPASLFQTGGGFSRATWESVWGSPHFAQVAVTKVGGGTIDAGATATIRNVWAEVHDKAKIVVIADRGYKSWVDTAYPDLKASGVPVTWAPDLDQFGSNQGTIFEAITEERLHQLAVENGNSVSFHGKTGNATSTMTPAQLADETAYCVAWLRRHNYQGRIWRAAYVQNNAPAVEDPLVTSQLIGSAYSITSLTVRDQNPIWPPISLYRLPRGAVENASSGAANQTKIDGWFSRLATDHGTVFVFFHRIDESDQFSTRKADWDYFMAKVRAGISGGWLEGVTFEDLYYGSGGNFEQRNGRAKSYWTAKPTTRHLT